MNTHTTNVMSKNKTEICSFLLLTIDGLNKITEILQAQINR